MRLPDQKPLKNIDLNGVVADFDGVRPTLKIVDDSSLAALKIHARTDRAPLRGRRCEYLLAWGKRGGERILAAHSIVPVAVISELEVSSWVKGNRPGFQIMLRVRLPRSVDAVGEPASLYLLGDRYHSVGQWQKLRVADFDVQLAERIRAMRAEFQRPVDAGEAYVDQVVFNVFGGAAENHFWVDDLAIRAGVPARVASGQSTRERSHSNGARQDWSGRVPRIVAYRGQPLADVARQGFNGVEFTRPPTHGQLDMLNKHRLQAVMKSGARSDHAGERIASNQNRQRQIGQRVPVVRVSWSSASRDGSGRREENAANVVEMTRTDLPPGWVDLGSVGGGERWLPLRKKLREAVFEGATGFVFDPVRFSDRPAYRNAVAELVNLELDLFRPWILRRASTDRIYRSSESGCGYWGMFGQHAGIIWVPRANANQVKSTRIGSPTIDVPEALNRHVHFLAPGGIAPAQSRRIPGGIRISLARHDPCGLLLLTDQPKVLKGFADQMAAMADQYNEQLARVIRYELLRLDQRLSDELRDPKQITHLREQVHALHGRLAQVLDSSETRNNFPRLDHFLWQLEKVQQAMERRSPDSAQN